MTNRRRPRFALASVLAAGLMLTVASCGNVTPLGPDPAATVPQPHPLRSPFVLQDMRMKQPMPAGCASGSVTISGSLGQCYVLTGKPVTVTSAAVSPLTSWIPSGYSTQVSTRQLEVMLTSRNQAIQLQDTLAPAA